MGTRKAAEVCNDTLKTSRRPCCLCKTHNEKIHGLGKDRQKTIWLEEILLLSGLSDNFAEYPGTEPCHLPGFRCHHHWRFLGSNSGRAVPTKKILGNAHSSIPIRCTLWVKVVSRMKPHLLGVWLRKIDSLPKVQSTVYEYGAVAPADKAIL